MSVDNQFNSIADKLQQLLKQHTRLKKENEQLRKELARVTTQRDILKKTMGILSEP